MLEHGFDSRERLETWLRRLGVAATESLVPVSQLTRTLQEALTRAFERATSSSRLLKLHPGVSEYTLERVRPQLRAELDRRIVAAAGLIRLNRDASVQRTLQRFAGWSTSIPIGGTAIPQRQEARKAIRKEISALPFEERRVIIDQGHKLSAAVSDIIAKDGGAIAATWWHVRETGYKARPEHLDRDGEIFIIRDNWAMKDGLMRTAGASYTDQIEQPGEFVYCRCTYEYLYSLRDLPSKMLTLKGRAKLAEVKLTLRNMHENS